MTEITMQDLGYKRIIISDHAGEMAHERDCWIDKRAIRMARVVSRSTVEKSRMPAKKFHIYAVADDHYWLIFKKTRPNTIVLKTVIPLSRTDKEMLEIT